MEFLNASRCEQDYYINNMSCPNMTNQEYVLTEGELVPEVEIRRGGRVTVNFDPDDSEHSTIELKVMDNGRNVIGFYVPSAEVEGGNTTLSAPYFSVYCECDSILPFVSVQSDRSDFIIAHLSTITR